MPSHTEDQILLQDLIPSKNAITITQETVKFVNEDGISRHFPGGTREYDIDLKERKLGKKSSIIIITIRKLLPRCPITNEPIQPGTGYKFEIGYALNKYKTRYSQHPKYKLNQVYYAKIGKLAFWNYYVVVKVIDLRQIDAEKLKHLENIIPYDIIQMLSNMHFEDKKNEYNFQMFYNHGIIPEVLYSLNGIRELFMRGIIDIGIDPADGFESPKCIEIISTESYNHVYPNGGCSSIKDRFPNQLDTLHKARQKIIDLYLA